MTNKKEVKKEDVKVEKSISDLAKVVPFYVLEEKGINPQLVTQKEIAKILDLKEVKTIRIDNSLNLVRVMDLEKKGGK